jgi:hypothetical protein
MNFTLICGVIADSIENNAFPIAAGIEIFQRLGKKSFFER